jgi:hypothetical protein
LPRFSAPRFIPSVASLHERVFSRNGATAQRQSNFLRRAVAPLREKTSVKLMNHRYTPHDYLHLLASTGVAGGGMQRWGKDFEASVHDGSFAGNVFPDGFMESFNSEPAVKFRKYILSNRMPICNRCCGLYMTNPARKFEQKARRNLGLRKDVTVHYH